MKKKILAVDDESRLRDLLKLQFESKGFEILTVPDADQALTHLSNDIFDLIIMDLNLGQETGLEVLKKIRDLHSKIPVIIFSGAVTPEIEEAAKSLGAQAVVSKGADGLRALTEKTLKLLSSDDKRLSERSKSILIVDDEAGIRNILSSFFNMKGITAHTAENGAKALEIALKEKPSVVLLDYYMPGMNGLETLKKLHEMDASLPVIMMTGGHENELLKSSMSMGAFSYLMKPFDFLSLELLVMPILSPG